MSNYVDKGKRPMYPYQSGWISHWPPLQEQNQSSARLEDHENDTKHWHFQNDKPRKEIKAIDFGILNGNQGMSLRNQRNDKLESIDSSIVNLSQESQHIPNIGHVLPVLSLAPPGTETSYVDFQAQHRSVSPFPREPMKSRMILGSSLALSAPLPENFNGRSSRVSPQIIDFKKVKYESGSIATAPSYICSAEENVNHVASIPSSKRKSSDTTMMKVLEHERHPDGSRVVADNLFMRNNHPSVICEQQYKRMHSSYGANMIPTCSHVANAMRMYTSERDLGGSTPGYQESRTFLVMENRDKNLREENHNNKNSRVLEQVQKNVPIKCYSFPQLISHGKQGVQIQQLSSTDNEGQYNVQDVDVAEIVSKKLSSAKADTMETRNKQFSGVESSSLKKDVKANTVLQHRDLAIVIAGEGVKPHKCPIPEIPDMNIEVHAELDEASVVENAEPSTSRTRSLDMDYEPNSSSRWIKRLKISDSCYHSNSTKSLSLGESTTNYNANQLVSKGIRGKRYNSIPVPKSACKELMVLNQKTVPIRTANSCSNDDVDGGEGSKQLRSWIQRWQKNPAAAPQKKSEPVVVCDPQSSKVSLEELQKKPFASIAVMALLGKGWSGLKCQYRNKGPLTLWESEDM